MKRVCQHVLIEHNHPGLLRLMKVFQAMKQVIGFEIMKLFFHVQTCFCVSTLA